MSTNQHQLELCEAIAREAHAGQFRRDGVTPYITHVEDVVSRVRYADWMTVCTAWLHDVLEDCPEFTVDVLRARGVAEVVIQGVIWLTFKPGDDYMEKIKVIAGCSIPRAVKIADNLSNLSSEPSKNQVKKYSKSLSILLSGTLPSYHHSEE